MASAVARAYNGGLGLAVPPAGSRGRAPGQGVWGQNPPEAGHNYTFHKPIGKIPSSCKLLKLGYPLAVSFVSINDVALTHT